MPQCSRDAPHHDCSTLCRSWCRQHQIWPLATALPVSRLPRNISILWTLSPQNFPITNLLCGQVSVSSRSTKAVNASGLASVPHCVTVPEHGEDMQQQRLMTSLRSDSISLPSACPPAGQHLGSLLAHLRGDRYRSDPPAAEPPGQPLRQDSCPQPGARGRATPASPRRERSPCADQPAAPARGARSRDAAAPSSCWCFSLSETPALNSGLSAHRICRRGGNPSPAERAARRHAEQVWVCIALSSTGHIQVLIPEECTPCSICL